MVIMDHIFYSVGSRQRKREERTYIMFPVTAEVEMTSPWWCAFSKVTRSFYSRDISGVPVLLQELSDQANPMSCMARRQYVEMHDEILARMEEGEQITVPELRALHRAVLRLHIGDSRKSDYIMLLECVLKFMLFISLDATRSSLIRSIAKTIVAANRLAILANQPGIEWDSCLFRCCEDDRQMRR